MDVRSPSQKWHEAIRASTGNLWIIDERNPGTFAESYLPETCRVNSREVFLLLVVFSANTERGVGRGPAGDNVVLILIVDKVFVVVAAHVERSVVER